MIVFQKEHIFCNSNSRRSPSKIVASSMDNGSDMRGRSNRHNSCVSLPCWFVLDTANGSLDALCILCICRGQVLSIHPV
jgi:hypothetical protein